MSVELVEIPLPAVPLDVAEFAARKEFTRYMRPILEALGKAYRGCTIQCYMEEDAEIEHDWRIIFDIDVTGWDSERIRKASEQWESVQFSVCPPSQIGVYCTLISINS